LGFSRYGLSFRGADDDALDQVLGALEEVPHAERRAAELFYLEGLTISEIAQQTQSAEGTVKRRLFQARENLRRALGIVPLERRTNMMSKKSKEKPPFPLRRPDIIITPSRARPFGVDCRELPGFFVIPEVGRRSLWATYDPPDWTLTEVTEMHARRPACIHNLECVEVEAREWTPDPGWTPVEWLHYARLTPEKVQWLAVSKLVDDKRTLHTFLDEGFDRDWGEIPRKLVDRGRFAQQEDGSLRQRKSRRCQGPGTIGAGMFRVKVAENAFTCLRILDVREPSETGILAEQYLTRAGRTVLFRRYNGRQWGRHRGSIYDGPAWDERFPHHSRIVIDGITFVHWYDCLSELAIGATPRSKRNRRRSRSRR
jgi:hypothetical protein